MGICTSINHHLPLIFDAQGARFLIASALLQRSPQRYHACRGMSNAEVFCVVSSCFFACQAMSSQISIDIWFLIYIYIYICIYIYIYTGPILEHPKWLHGSTVDPSQAIKHDPSDHVFFSNRRSRSQSWVVLCAVLAFAIFCLPPPWNTRIEIIR